jgi:hypothetical protein
MIFFANRSFITTTPQPNNKNARLAVGHHCNSKDDWQWSWFTSLWRGITLQREQQQQSLRATIVVPGGTAEWFLVASWHVDRAWLRSLVHTSSREVSFLGAASLTCLLLEQQQYYDFASCHLLRFCIMPSSTILHHAVSPLIAGPTASSSKAVSVV